MGWRFSSSKPEEPEPEPPVQAVITPHIWWYQEPENDAECYLGDDS